MISPEDCSAIIEAFKTCRGSIPVNCRGIRTRMLTQTREYVKALKMYEQADGFGAEMPEIVPAGAVEPGQYILLGSGPAKVRRVTDSGIEIMERGEGRWSWENISSRMTPVCTVEIEVER